MTLESVTASTSNVNTTTSTDSSTILDSDAFLQLLITEIQYQDPLDPMDSTEYVTQLAELSELEQLTSINENMTGVMDGMDELTAMSSLSYIGKSVEVDGGGISLEDGSATPVTVDVSEDAAEVTINIFDADGNIMESETFTDVSSGEFDFTWDGLDYDGEQMEDGSYTALVSATDEYGDTVSVDTTISGTVTGVQNTDSGVVLTLDDGRTVNAAYVGNIGNIS